MYSSRSTHPFTEEELTDLLTQSRTNNARLDLSGMLLFREGRFLQVLEGPDELLRQKMATIAQDPRHTDVRTLLEENIDNRFFGQWTMRYQTISDQDAATIPGYRTSFDDLTNNVTTGATLPALRELIRWFQNPPRTTGT